MLAKARDTQIDQDDTFLKIRQQWYSASDVARSANSSMGLYNEATIIRHCWDYIYTMPNIFSFIDIISQLSFFKVHQVCESKVNIEIDMRGRNLHTLSHHCTFITHKVVQTTPPRQISYDINEEWDTILSLLDTQHAQRYMIEKQPWMLTNSINRCQYDPVIEVKRAGKYSTSSAHV